MNDLSPSALEDLRRLYSYGWLPRRIAHVFNQLHLHGLDLTPAEIKRFCRDNKAPLEAEPEDEPDRKPEENRRKNQAKGVKQMLLENAD